MRILKTLSSILLLMFGLLAEAQIDTNWFSGMNYRNLGPNRGGRCAAVCGSTVDRDLFYMGTTGGGIWKTTDGGSHWKNISDGYFGGSIGSIEIAPGDENVIYVGQGEETLRGNVSSGEGMWKSVDAGKTWKFIGLKESRHIPRIAVHPRDENVVMAAVLGDLFKDSEQRGIYRSEDGGKSWNRVLFVNKEVGCNDIVFDPHNHRNVFAATWKVRRTPFGFSSGGEGSGIWRSRDEGKTWKDISSNPGLPQGIKGKITLAPSKAKKDLVYAIIEHASQGGLYVSHDGGDHWKRVNGESKIRQRAWYFSRVTADPKDPNTVYVMNVRFQKSTDGGKSFNAINTPHVDHHQLWIDPNDANRMIVANDGGGQVSYNGGGSWSTYFNQPTEQFYRVTTDDYIPYRIYVAQQDNSTMRVNHLTGQWEPTAGGESAHIAPDPKDPEIVYAGSYGGYLTRKNHRTGDNRGINVWPDNPLGYGAEGMKYRFQWNFPLFFSPHDTNMLYAASNHLHVSTDQGNSWKVISPDLTRNDSSKLVTSGGPITKDNTGVEYYCTIFAAKEAPLEKGTLYVGSDDGLIHVSRNGGKDWTNITPKNMPEWLMINHIECDPHKKGAVYAVATGYKLGNYQPYIYVSSDYGASWKLCVKGIKNEHFVRALACDKKRPGLWYAGTERGMYISWDYGENWQPFQLNLPIVPITDLHQKENDLIVATQGRGIWIIDELGALQSGMKRIPVYNGIIASSGDYVTRGAKATLIYYLKDSLKPKERFVIDVLDNQGRVIRSWSVKGNGNDTIAVNPKAGINYLSWNLRYPKAYVPSDMILWAARTSGPIAPSGKYLFRMTVGDKTLQSLFSLEHNTYLEGSEDDARAKFEFQAEVVEVLDSAHHSLDKMSSTVKQINQILNRHKDFGNDNEIVKLGNSLVKEIDSLRNDIYQTKLRSEQDPINYPIRLNNKLGHVNYLVSMGSYGPTDQAVEVKDELVAAIYERLDRYQRLVQNEVNQFNKMLRDQGVDFVVPE